jgi:hypothetical protein
MSTLAEIEAAAEALPREQKEKLFHFLATRLRSQESRRLEKTSFRRSRRGFPISPGRTSFASTDVARIEAEADVIT